MFLNVNYRVYDFLEIEIAMEHIIRSECIAPHTYTGTPEKP